MQSQRLEQQVNTPRVRTRQGCWSCRRRRRKCDENKPSCQNCIKKGLRCKYGIQLTFHGANLFELDAHAARDLRTHAPENYQNLQFVDGLRDDQGGQSHSHSNERPPSTRNSLEPESEIVQQTPGNAISIARRDSIQHKSNFQRDYDGNALDLDYDTVEDPQTVMEDSSRIRSMDFSITPTAFHLDGRAENGSYHPQSGSLGPGRLSDIASSSSHSFVFPSQVSSNNSRSRVQLRNLDAAAPGPGNHLYQSRSNPSVKTCQQLVKYYIDSVAPWLELCSLDALYSILIPLVSSKYEPLRQVILALAALQSRREGDNDLGASFMQASLQSLRSDIYSRREEPIVTRRLHLIARLLSHPMRQWRSVLNDDMSTFNDPYIHGFLDGIRGTVSWLTLRFDLATTIISQSPLTTNLKHWNRIQTPSPSSTGMSTQSAYLHEVLYLCAEVLDFSHSTTNRNDTGRWTPFLYKLHDLEKLHSPSIAMPLLSTPIGKTIFSKSIPTHPARTIPSSLPVFIFTNRTSFYTSFLINVTKLLLVQCKPCNIESRAVKGFRTASWYAVQICGLSSSNTKLWSWDPLIVAALLFAGSFLSYSEQQLELMEHLKILRQMTGWMFEQEIQDLGEFWKRGC